MLRVACSLFQDSWIFFRVSISVCGATDTDETHSHSTPCLPFFVTHSTLCLHFHHISHYQQEARGGGKSVLQTVLQSDDLREALLAQEKIFAELQEVCVGLKYRSR